MNNPCCHSTDSFICDSRMSNGTIRRRRVCRLCGHRFTTYEVSRDEYDRLNVSEKMLVKATAATKSLAKRLGIECGS